MLESSDIIGYVNCPLIETSVMFDASKRHKVWVVESISLSRQGFRIYSFIKGRPSLVKSFSGNYRIFRNYIQPANESPLEIISSFNDIFTLETLVECKNDVAVKSRYFDYH